MRTVHNLRRYPSWSNQRMWHKELKFIKRKESLLQYFMTPSGGLRDGAVIGDLLGKIMVGIDNSEDWRAAAGFEISKKEFSGNVFQVGAQTAHV